MLSDFIVVFNDNIVLLVRLNWNILVQEEEKSSSQIFVRGSFKMAQTFNQKRNVYSIDQILGHGKSEGMS